MSIDIVRGSSQKPVSGRKLAELISHQTHLFGQLFIGYPIIATPEGPYLIDAILVSADKGIVIFDLIEGTDSGDYAQRQDDSANKLEARLKTHRELVQRRDLRIPIYTISFAPGINNYPLPAEGDYQLVNSSSFAQALESFTWEGREDEIYKNALSALESISTIRKGRVKRAVQKEDSRGRKLQGLENSIATLDNTQGKAVIETIDGVQRIRGLAGSGKTIVLALKAAYLHALHPEWRIGVTFNTSSLKGQFRRLINTFSIEKTGEEPDWENLRILNAWGTPGGGNHDGIYSEFCRAHDIAYFDFMSAKRQFGGGREFSGACEHALSQANENKHIYDAILVDEAQDFSPVFLRLCYELLGNPKRLVYAYDELQSLSGGSLPPPEEIFGKKPDGSPVVRFDASPADGPRPDIILERCYRNSRPVLVTAHALGFGIYREPTEPPGMGLVQMFDQPRLWEEIGYRVQDGDLQEGSSVTLYRPEDTSPRFLEDHSDLSDLIQFISFDSEEEQTDWLIGAIKKNLEKDELRHDDIIVINPNPLTTRKKVGPIRSHLLEIDIASHLAGVDTNPDIFFQNSPEGSVTFTGIHHAKGNEAGMVYLINAQDCQAKVGNLASLRNQLFTALTRSKAWIRVLGVGRSMKEIKQEYEKLREQNFKLKFTYPTQEQRRRLRIIHRDMTQVERNRLKSRQKSLDDLIKDIESGTVHIEDLDKESVARLKTVLQETE